MSLLDNASDPGRVLPREPCLGLSSLAIYACLDARIGIQQAYWESSDIILLLWLLRENRTLRLVSDSASKLQLRQLATPSPFPISRAAAIIRVLGLLYTSTVLQAQPSLIFPNSPC